MNKISPFNNGVSLDVKCGLPYRVIIAQAVCTMGLYGFTDKQPCLITGVSLGKRCKACDKRLSLISDIGVGMTAGNINIKPEFSINAIFRNLIR